MTDHEILADAIRKRRSAMLNVQTPLSYGPLFIPDLPGYESPVTGRRIEGRRARREDLKQSGSVEYDPGMKADAVRNHAANEAKLDAAISQTVETIYNQLPSDKRRQLEQEADMLVEFNRRR